MNTMKKIAFLTSENPLDKRSWSGIYYRMFESLKNEFEEVIILGPIKLPFIIFLLKIFQFLTWIFIHKKYNKGHSVILSKACSKIIQKKLKNNDFDAIFAPSASLLIAYLKVDIPIFYYADATVNLMIDYYISDLSKLSINESNLIERKAINNASFSIFSSAWAANDAIITYKANPDRVAVVKMGANIESAPKNIKLTEKLDQKVCNLLFLGVDWKRKGGDIVFETLLMLLKQGFDTQLIVCGCIPPVKHPNMIVHPFLNKNIERDYKIFTQLLDEAHFLFLPTRAECAGIVFCEAAANGIPSITTSTGGVTNYVINEINGYTLPLSSNADDYAQIIKKVFTNKELYTKLSKQSRKLYFEELNWEIWAKRIKEILYKSSDTVIT